MSIPYGHKVGETNNISNEQLTYDFIVFLDETSLRFRSVTTSVYSRWRRVGRRRLKGSLGKRSGSSSWVRARLSLTAGEKLFTR